MLRPLCGLILLSAPATLCAQVTPDPPPQPVNLEGLWVAESNSSPIHGPLLIYPRGSGLVADIAGFTMPVRESGKALSFGLPDGKGDFRGIRSGNEILGQWIQEARVSAGTRFSTPVQLRPDGPGRWRSEIVPLEDRMTFYLPVTRAGDGTYATYLRNPERNAGRFIPVTRIAMKGDNVELLGTRRGAKEESVLSSGRYDRGADAIRIAINGRSLDFMRDTSATSTFYPRSKSGEVYAYHPPVALNDGWPVSTLAKEGVDQAAIERFVQSLIDQPQQDVSTMQIHSLLIARHGKLVLEEYFHGASRDEPHDLRSASKSWTAILLGAAMQAGVPIRLDTPVYQTMLGSTPADLDPRKKAMTLEHLISMTAGFDCDDSGDRPGDEDVFQQQSKQPNWYRYMLDVPMAWNSGDRIVYCSGKPNLAAGMLQKIAGEPLPEMFDRLIARPLHMGRYYLFLQPTGEAYGGGGHRFTSRDFLKFAQLMVNGGVWEGHRMFSRQWAQQSGAPLRMLIPRFNQTYGYLWNSKAFDYQGRKIHAFFAGGNGGQVSVGIPELDMTMVFTGGNYADPVLFNSTNKYVPESILPAVH